MASEEEGAIAMGHCDSGVGQNHREQGEVSSQIASSPEERGEGNGEFPSQIASSQSGVEQKLADTDSEGVIWQHSEELSHYQRLAASLDFRDVFNKALGNISLTYNEIKSVLKPIWSARIGQTAIMKFSEVNLAVFKLMKLGAFDEGSYLRGVYQDVTEDLLRQKHNSVIYRLPSFHLTRLETSSTIVKKFEGFASGRDQEIASLNQIIINQKQDIASYQNIIEGKKEEISSQEKTIANQKQEINCHKNVVLAYEKELLCREATIQELEERIVILQETLKVEVTGHSDIQTSPAQQNDHIPDPKDKQAEEFTLASDTLPNKKRKLNDGEKETAPEHSQNKKQLSNPHASENVTFPPAASLYQPSLAMSTMSEMTFIKMRYGKAYSSWLEAYNGAEYGTKVIYDLDHNAKEVGKFMSDSKCFIFGQNIQLPVNIESFAVPPCNYSSTRGVRRNKNGRSIFPTPIAFTHRFDCYHPLFQQEFLEAIEAIVCICLYIFASRFMPHLLLKWRWICPEMVELGAYLSAFHGQYVPAVAVNFPCGAKQAYNLLSLMKKLRNDIHHKNTITKGRVEAYTSAAVQLCKGIKDKHGSDKLSRMLDAAKTKDMARMIAAIESPLVG